jgi:putative transposon-encoded protein
MSWHLLFSGASSAGWVIFASLGVLSALILSFWLLRLERRMVPPAAGWTLLGLRLLVLALLFLILLQPLLTKRFDVEERGRVVVAVDASLSMETQDRHASLAEKLRWAQALGMLGSDDTAARIDNWVVQAEAGSEPDWLGIGRTPANAVERAAADSRKRQVEDALEELGQMPRTEFVRRLLLAQPRELLRNLGDVMPVDLRVFATEQQATAPEQLEQRLVTDRRDLMPGGTGAVQTLQSVLAEESGRQVRSFVLISDGRQTLPTDAAGEAQRLAALGIPVHTIPIGSRLPPRDLSVAALESPETVFLNDNARIRAVLGTSGFEGQALSVRLERDGETVQQQTVTPVGDSAVVDFTVPTDRAGRFDYRLVSDVQVGELREDNNSRDVNLRVVDNKARVMLLEGDARWEFRYLRNVLERDRQVQSTTVLFRQPYLEILNEPAMESKLPPAEAFRQQLALTDLLVVGDVDPQEVEEEVWKLVEDAVTRDGLTLLVIPGRRSMPAGYTSETLSGMLPVSEFRQQLAEQFQPSVQGGEQSVYRLVLSAEAEGLPMFQLGPKRDVGSGGITALPGHPWVYTGVPRPGAKLWASAMLPGGGGESSPVIVHQDYGFGQTVWMGIDSTWRWRLRAGDEWHYQFWGQLIRWAARNKAAAGNSDVRMTVADVVLGEEESAEIAVRWDRRLVPQLAEAVMEVVAERLDERGEVLPPLEGEPAITARLRPAADAPERFNAKMPPLPEGTWRLRLQVTGSAAAPRETVATEVLVRRQLSGELANVSCNREFLQQLSELSGGRMIEPSDARQLLELVQPQDEPEQKVQERTLWDHWLVILLFSGLLMAEWVVRKVNGLP